jgi:hypothetical protein
VKDEPDNPDMPLPNSKQKEATAVKDEPDNPDMPLPNSKQREATTVKDEHTERRLSTEKERLPADLDKPEI